MLSFIIGVVLRIVNIMFGFFPLIGDITNGFSQALTALFGQAVAWDWLLPIHESLQLVVKAIQFEFAVMMLWFGKWVVEMIRGK